jgi:cytochrome c oxidase subunit 2
VRTPARVLGLATVSTGVLCACSGPASATDPAGPGADRANGLWIGMAAAAGVIVVGVVGLLLFSLFRRRRGETGPIPRVDDRVGTGLVVGGGVVLPIVVLFAVFVATLFALRAQAHEDDAAHPLTIDVVGHRWWWEVNYPAQRIRTANELHIPVGESVAVHLSSPDVIHSLWVPSLQVKTDAIPGHANDMVLEADRAGTFRGECAEFCGLQHANMAFVVVAESPQDFASWVRDRQTVAETPPSGAVFQGQQLFLGSSCVYCHTIAGTNATGAIGPDLTHVASRPTLGAGAVPNTPAELRAWISNAQALKPGNLMPPIRLSDEELDDLVAYLESLH